MYLKCKLDYAVFRIGRSFYLWAVILFVDWKLSDNSNCQEIPVEV